MAQLFVNNLTLTLAGDTTANQPTLSVVSATGLPNFSVGDWMYLTITDIREGGELRWEVVKVTSWTGTTLTVVRGQDSTTGKTWFSGAKASLRVTASDMRTIQDKLPASSYTAADVLTKLKTVAGAGSGLDADTVGGKHANEFAVQTEMTNALAGKLGKTEQAMDSAKLGGVLPSGFSKAAVGVVTNATDWNTLTTHGTYKVQCTLGSNPNQPPCYYTFGVLDVSVSEIGGENRILQVYTPHNQDSFGDPFNYQRMTNNGSFTPWLKTPTVNSDVIWRYEVSATCSRLDIPSNVVQILRDRAMEWEITAEHNTEAGITAANDAMVVLYQNDDNGWARGIESASDPYPGSIYSWLGIARLYHVQPGVSGNGTTCGNGYSYATATLRRPKNSSNSNSNPYSTTGWIGSVNWRGHAPCVATWWMSASMNWGSSISSLTSMSLRTSDGSLGITKGTRITIKIKEYI